MTTKSSRLVHVELAIDAMGLLAMPHDIAPFGDAARWETYAYDDDNRCIGVIVTDCVPKGAGTRTFALLSCASQTTLEGRQTLWL